MDTPQTISDQVDSTQSLFAGSYPTPNDFDLQSSFIDELFLDFPQDHLRDGLGITTATEAQPNDSSNTSIPKSTKIQRPLLPRDSSAPAPAPVPPMFEALPSGCRDAAINATMINDLYNRMLIIENTAPTFRQMIDVRARLTAMEARLNGMEARHIDAGARQTFLETRQTDMEKHHGDLSGRFEQNKVRMSNNIAGLHEWCGNISGAHVGGVTTSPVESGRE